MAQFPISYSTALPPNRGQNVESSLMSSTGEAGMWGQVANLGNAIYDVGIKIKEADDKVKYSTGKRTVDEIMYKAYQDAGQMSDETLAAQRWEKAKQEIAKVDTGSPRANQQLSLHTNEIMPEWDRNFAVQSLGIKKKNVLAANETNIQSALLTGNLEDAKNDLNEISRLFPEKTAENNQRIKDLPITSKLSQMKAMSVTNPRVALDEVNKIMESTADKWNTKLPSQQEQEFQQWMDRIGHTKEKGFNVTSGFNGIDYDYRGYFKKYGGKDIGQNEHLTDEFKKPSHPTFSNESQYSTPENPGGSWNGDIYTPSDKPYTGLNGWSVAQLEKLDTIRTESEAELNKSNKALKEQQDKEQWQFYKMSEDGTLKQSDLDKSSLSAEEKIQLWNNYQTVQSQKLNGKVSFIEEGNVVTLANIGKAIDLTPELVTPEQIWGLVNSDQKIGNTVIPKGLGTKYVAGLVDRLKTNQKQEKPVYTKYTSELSRLHTAGTFGKVKNAASSETYMKLRNKLDAFLTTNPTDEQAGKFFQSLIRPDVGWWWSVGDNELPGWDDNPITATIGNKSVNVTFGDVVELDGVKYQAVSRKDGTVNWLPVPKAR